MEDTRFEGMGKWIKVWKAFLPEISPAESLFMSWVIDRSQRLYHKRKQEKIKLLARGNPIGEKPIDKGLIYCEHKHVLKALSFLNGNLVKSLVYRLKEKSLLWTEKARLPLFVPDPNNPKPPLVTHFRLDKRIILRIFFRCRNYKDLIIEGHPDQLGYFGELLNEFMGTGYFPVFKDLIPLFKNSTDCIFYHWLLNFCGEGKPEWVATDMAKRITGLCQETQTKALNRLKKLKLVKVEYEKRYKGKKRLITVTNPLKAEGYNIGHDTGKLSAMLGVKSRPRIREKERKNKHPRLSAHSPPAGASLPKSRESVKIPVLFGEPKQTKLHPSHLLWSNQLKIAIRSYSLKQIKPSMKSWGMEFSKLEKLVGSERIEKVLSWYCQNIKRLKELYIPNCQSAKKFRLRFEDVERAMKKQIDVSGPVSDQANEVSRQILRGRDWKPEAIKQLPHIVQQNLDKRKQLYGKLRGYLNECRESDGSYRFAPNDILRPFIKYHVLPYITIERAIIEPLKLHHYRQDLKGNRNDLLDPNFAEIRNWFSSHKLWCELTNKLGDLL